MSAGLSDRELKREQRRARRAAVPAGGAPATRRALADAEAAHSLVLVEGLSDQIALETLAARRGRDLGGEGVAVVPIGGAHAVGRFVDRFAGRRVVGLCDAGEEEVFRRHLPHVHVCVRDLEDELLRALGLDRVIQVIGAQGDAQSFRTFTKQPAWRGRPVYAQLRRYLGSADRRKLRYARAFVEALDLARVPDPLDRVLADVARPR